jgi:hypothetical protein
MDKAQPIGRPAEILLVEDNNFIRVVRSIESFWLTVVTLPAGEST